MWFESLWMRSASFRSAQKISLFLNLWCLFFLSCLSFCSLKKVIYSVGVICLMLQDTQPDKRWWTRFSFHLQWTNNRKTIKNGKRKSTQLTVEWEAVTKGTYQIVITSHAAYSGMDKCGSCVQLHRWSECVLQIEKVLNYFVFEKQMAGK